MRVDARTLAALTRILAPYAGQPLNRAAVDLALKLARLEAAA